MMTTAMFAGIDAAGRARRAGEALIARAERLLAAEGPRAVHASPRSRSSAPATRRPEADADAATEVVVKIGARHAEQAGAGGLRGRVRADGLVAQGMTGFFAGRPRVAPVFRVYHLLVDKATPRRR